MFKKNKIQILLIHGGMTFRSQRDYIRFLKTRKVSLEPRVRWSDDYLEKQLGRNFKIIRPRMPLQDNAKYSDWKIWFERHLKLLTQPTILIGNSLGGVFLAKYLSEHKLKSKALSVYLVCPPYDNSMPGEDLAGGFNLKQDLSLLEQNTQNLYLMFSEDDDVVPVVHAEKYKKKLPNAAVIIYKSKNCHFNIRKFPEIVKMIKLDARKV